MQVYASGWGGSIRPGPGGEGTKVLTSTMPLTSDADKTVTDGNDFYIYVLSQRFENSKFVAKEIKYASYFGGTTTDDHVDGGTSRFDKNGVMYQSVCASCGGSPN